MPRVPMGRENHVGMLNIARCQWRDPKGDLQPVKPNIKMVANVLAGLRAVTYLDNRIVAPSWLTDPAACADSSRFRASSLSRTSATTPPARSTPALTLLPLGRTCL